MALLYKLLAQHPFFVLKKWKEVKDNHPFSPPYIIKPRDEGSSIGVTVVRKGDETVGSKFSSWIYSEPIIVERYINGIEISVPIIGNVVLPAISIHPSAGFYDYLNKYKEGKTEHVVPAKIPDHIYQNVQERALQVHKTLECKGISRTDFIYSPDDDEVYLLELNTQLGMTQFSLLPKAAAYAHISYSKICSWLIEEALMG